VYKVTFSCWYRAKRVQIPPGPHKNICFGYAGMGVFFCYFANHKNGWNAGNVPRINFQRKLARGYFIQRTSQSDLPYINLEHRTVEVAKFYLRWYYIYMEVFDSIFGRVELTSERWNHIVTFHPEIRTYRKFLGKALTHPDITRRSNTISH
jgi:hypothetical protein